METFSRKSKHIGIGGIRCGCCAPFKNIKKAKRLLNRTDRRMVRQALRQAVSLQ